ncbi:MAG: tRNA (guanine-N7)-methyltransferase [Myxococcales bacterium]|nr:tRNA (guanine-N7)-methyltransferase [Myxococcales bacterium]
MTDETTNLPDENAKPAATKVRPKSYAHAPRLPDDGGRVKLASIFASDGPVMLEIGPGRGRFALELLAARPDWSVLALEIRRKLAFNLDERMGAKGYGARARCFAEDAREALPRIEGTGVVSAAAIHFPDPWWKKRHAKRMVVGDSLVDELARLVKPGGIVLVQTDVIERAEAYYPRFAEHPAFASKGTAERPYVEESPFVPARSNREAMAITDGLPVYRMVFERR